ncbi:MAG: hypothetical protein KDE01_05880 [Caldilineaceae bacterium]|nr:hypothetical protein [Caldilineaceae bacterium]
MQKQLFNLNTGERESIEWPPETIDDVLPYVPREQHLELRLLVNSGKSVADAAIIAIENAMRLPLSQRSR